MNSANMLITDVELAKDIYRDGGIKFGSFRLKHHAKWPDAPESPIYISLRLPDDGGTLTPETIDKIGRYLVHFSDELPTTWEYVAGPPRAGERLAVAFARYALATSLLRLGKEGEGDARRIVTVDDEVYPAGGRVLLIDDLITAAGTKLEAIAALRAADMEVIGCLVLVDREQGGKEEMEAAGVPFYAAFTMTELLEIYVREGVIGRTKAEEVLSYRQRHEDYVASLATSTSG